MIDECVAPVPVADAPFVPASVDAVHAWSFFAAAIGTTAADGGDCVVASPGLPPRPTRMAYVFTFENLDGQPKAVAQRR